MTKRQPITDAHHDNAAASFSAAGLNIDVLPRLDQDYLCRAWAFYVDRGLDFGSAAIRVMDDIEKAADDRQRESTHVVGGRDG